MAEIFRFPDSARSSEEAALWLARLDKGLSDDQRAAFAAWLGESPMNRPALLELAALWDDLDRLHELSALFPLEGGVPPIRRRYRARWAVAASAVLAVLALGALLVPRAWLSPGDSAATSVASSQRFATPIGGHATHALADGSMLVLNTDTEVEVRLARETRDVSLRRGEAHFTIAHDAARPFRVRAGDRVLEAVGTAFNVHLKPAGAVELTVTDGTVKVARETAPSIAAGVPSGAARAPSADAVEPVTQGMVVEGELAILEPGDAGPLEIVALAAEALDTKLAWQRGMLIFEREPLERMLVEVGRYTTTQFEYEDDEIRELKVGGYFRADDVDALLLDLRDALPIEFQRVAADRVVLRAR